MIIDKRLEFSDSQVVTATGASTNSIDIFSLGTPAPAAIAGATQRDVGPGEPVYVNIVLEAVSGTSPTLTVGIQTDDNSAFSSPTTKFTSATFTGTGIFSIPVGRSIINEQFARLNYTVGGTTPSFTISSFLSHEQPPQADIYPDAVNHTVT